MIAITLKNGIIIYSESTLEEFEAALQGEENLIALDENGLEMQFLPRQIKFYEANS